MEGNVILLLPVVCPILAGVLVLAGRCFERTGKA